MLWVVNATWHSCLSFNSSSCALVAVAVTKSFLSEVDRARRQGVLAMVGGTPLCLSLCHGLYACASLAAAVTNRLLNEAHRALRPAGLLACFITMWTIHHPTGMRSSRSVAAKRHCNGASSGMRPRDIIGFPSSSTVGTEQEKKDKRIQVDTHQVITMGASRKAVT